MAFSADVPYGLQEIADRVHVLIRRPGGPTRFRNQLLTWRSQRDENPDEDPIDLRSMPDRELTVPEKYTIVAAAHDVAIMDSDGERSRYRCDCTPAAG